MNTKEFCARRQVPEGEVRARPVAPRKERLRYRVFTLFKGTWGALVPSECYVHL